ncbi:MAG TPA: lipopolysaccharide heptosyltransferase II [Candidatus Omnitrophota bacterium]|nr:lipopolysaccharide heptosyltransferase II [Candidatus Omnitrophota bacterium]HQO57346.1 lipopolysaccharide heptosyltransferase II [Candidatus Omnitrophota bacterium]HQP12104.1 lipopolysaccharide heptosyltransferase II [Candidatus Omnitrophota bacterium]
MKKILVVNVNWVGDTVFATPVFKAIKAEWPDAFVVCLAVPRVKAVLECCPHVDEIIIYDERGQHRGLLGKISIIWTLWRRHFDVAFLLHRSWTRALLIFLAGVKERVGYDVKNRGRFLTHRVPPSSCVLHRSDFYLYVVEHFGIPVLDRTCELIVDPEAQRQVRDLLASHHVEARDRLIIINVGANWDLKKWPAAYFAELIARLSQGYPARIVIPGAGKDVEAAHDINRRGGAQAIVLAGETNLKQLIALMHQASLVISADSGPMHIASAVGTPGIAIFGPTRPELTGPRGRGAFRVLQKDVGCNRQACYSLECPDNVCMQAVSVDEVLAVVRELLPSRK